MSSGSFRLFADGDVFLVERTDLDTNTLIPVMFETKVLQFTDRKLALKWLKMNGHKIEGHAGKKFAIVKMLDLIEVSVEALATVTILSRQREGAQGTSQGAPPVEAKSTDTAKAEA